MKIHPDVIGIDVSKMVLDVYEGRGGTWRQIGNDDKAIEAFVDGLAGLGVLVVLEATGLYDRKLRLCVPSVALWVGGREIVGSLVVVDREPAVIPARLQIPSLNS